MTSEPCPARGHLGEARPFHTFQFREQIFAHAVGIRTVVLLYLYGKII